MNWFLELRHKLLHRHHRVWSKYNETTYIEWCRKCLRAGPRTATDKASGDES